MTTDPLSDSKVTTYTYGGGGALLAVEELTEEQAGEADRRRASAEAAESPPFRFEHDAAGRVFRLTAADGTVQVFRDTPARYLCVEPDPETGAPRPVTKRGRPVYLELCREDREVR